MNNHPPLLPNTTYHFYNHANGNENLFKSHGNYNYFLDKYSQYIHPIAETYAYCLMPNHFHLMVKFRPENELVLFKQTKNKDFVKFEGEKEISLFLSKQFSNFLNGFTQGFNKVFNRQGSLFIPRFKRKIIDNNKYFDQLITYIHMNPIYHGFCKSLYDWQYSSFHAYYQNKSSKVNRELMNGFFERKNELIDFHLNFNIDRNLFDF